MYSCTHTKRHCQMGWVVNTTPRPLYPLNDCQYPFYSRLDLPFGLDRCAEKKISCPSGLRTPKFQLVGSHHTDQNIALLSREVYFLSDKRIIQLAPWSRSFVEKVEVCPPQQTVILCLPVWHFPPNRRIQLYQAAQQSSIPYFVSESLKRYMLEKFGVTKSVQTVNGSTVSKNIYKLCD